MDEFSYTTAFKVRTVASLCYPVVLLGGLGGMYFFVVEPSGGMVGFKYPGWVPLVAIGLVAWTAWEVRAAFAVFSYRLRLDDASVEAGAVKVAWADVVRVESAASAFGRKPAVTLHTRDGRTLAVPGALDGLTFVRSAITARARAVEEPGRAVP
jgi:hypothetical protein